MDRAKQILPWVAGLSAAGAFILYIVDMVLAGASPAGFLLFAFCFLVVVVLPGLFFTRRLLPGWSFAEQFVTAFPMGGLFTVLCFSLLGAFVPVWMALLPSVAVGLIGMVLFLREKKPLKAPRVSSSAWLLLLLFALCLAVYSFSGVLSAAHASVAGNMQYNQDLLWSVGNAGAVVYGSPLIDIRIAGGTLHYHYMADALTGLVAYGSGQSAWDAVCFYAWPLWAGSLLLAFWCATRRMGVGSKWALLSPALLALGHFGWENTFFHLYINANGVVQSNLMLGVLVMLLAGWDRCQHKTKLTGAVALVLGALMWSKSTVGLLAVCGVLAVFFMRWLRDKKADILLLLTGVAGLAAFGILYLTVYRYATNNLIFDPSFGAIAKAFKVVAVGYLPIFLMYLSLLFVSIKNFRRLSTGRLLVNALVPGGLAAYCLFSHYSDSQDYFLLAAGTAMVLCIAPALAELAVQAKKRSRILEITVGLLVAVAVCGTFVTGLPTLRHGAQVALRSLGMRPAFDRQADTSSPHDYEAAQWLAENLTEDELFAVNRNAKDPEAGEGVFHYYTAASGKRAFVESWRYGMDYSIDYFLLRHNLEQVSDLLYQTDSLEEASVLAEENGIGYIVVHLPSGGQAYQDAQPVFANEDILIYKP